MAGRARYLRVSENDPTKSVVMPSQCLFCNVPPQEMEVDGQGFYRWSNAGEFIQRALPDLSPGDREVLMSGTHDACFEAAFKEDDDE